MFTVIYDNGLSIGDLESTYIGTMKKKEDTAELKSTTALAALDSAGLQETVWLSLQ